MASGTGFSEVRGSADAKVETGRTMGEEEEEEKAFPESKGTAPDSDVTVEASETKYTLEFRDDSDVGLVDWSDGSEEEEDDDDDAILSDAEYQLVVDNINAKYDRFIERLRARSTALVFKNYTAADYADSDDGEVVHDHAEVEAAL